MPGMPTLTLPGLHLPRPSLRPRRLSRPPTASSLCHGPERLSSTGPTTVTSCGPGPSVLATRPGPGGPAPGGRRAAAPRRGDAARRGRVAAGPRP